MSENPWKGGGGVTIDGIVKSLRRDKKTIRGVPGHKLREAALDAMRKMERSGEVRRVGDEWFVVNPEKGAIIDRLRKQAEGSVERVRVRTSIKGGANLLRYASEGQFEGSTARKLHTHAGGEACYLVTGNLAEMMATLHEDNPAVQTTEQFAYLAEHVTVLGPDDEEDERGHFPQAIVTKRHDYTITFRVDGYDEEIAQSIVAATRLRWKDGSRLEIEGGGSGDRFSWWHFHGPFAWYVGEELEVPIGYLCDPSKRAAYIGQAEGGERNRPTKKITVDDFTTRLQGWAAEHERAVEVAKDELAKEGKFIKSGGLNPVLTDYQPEEQVAEFTTEKVGKHTVASALAAAQQMGDSKLEYLGESGDGTRMRWRATGTLALQLGESAADGLPARRCGRRDARRCVADPGAAPDRFGVRPLRRLAARRRLGRRPVRRDAHAPRQAAAL
jgi:hypothetical protein